MIELRELAPGDVGEARTIVAEYTQSLADVAGPSFAHQRIDDELRDLPGRYAPPLGTFVLAWKGARCVGCVAVRPLDPPGTCELKRLYVRPGHRGTGLGRRLCEDALTRARALGYARIKLDSDPSLAAALALYRRLGFRETARYNDDPVAETVYLERDLGSAGGPG